MFSLPLWRNVVAAWIYFYVVSCDGVVTYKFALCPKSVDNPFFDVSRDGCVDRAKVLTKESPEFEVECIYFGPVNFNPDGVEQAEMIMELIQQGDIDGLSISVLNPEVLRPVIQAATERGMPVVTFDSDDIESGRATYIGTDNFFFGRQLGKVVKQLIPTGGTYAILTDDTPNIIDRERGVRQELEMDKEEWKEVSVSPVDMQGNNTLAIQLMRALGRTYGSNLTAIITVMGGPMFLPELWVELVDEFPGILFVVGDGLNVQLDFLSKNKVGGLVAQLPYEMGSLSIDTLLGLALEQRNLTDTGSFSGNLPNFIGTNVLEHLRIPLVLPELTVDQNNLGKLKILGFTLYGIVLIFAIGFAVWTFWNRNVRVVRVAQPGFLGMVAAGIIIMGGAILPLGFDDSASNYSPRAGHIICMSPVWLIFLGFTITYSALFAKMWRVNRVFRSSVAFVRVTVTALDVLSPFIVLFSLNFVTLFVWTLLDPLRYERRAMEGTDPWNRVIATYGTCVMDQPWPYVTILVILNMGLLVIANVQAFFARNIQSEFSESKYIAMVVICMLQVCLIGIPLLLVVKELPQAWYLTLVFIIFLVCMVVLLLIFVPKVLSASRRTRQSDRDQQQILKQIIRNSHNRKAAKDGVLSGKQAVVDESSNRTEDQVDNVGKPTRNVSNSFPLTSIQEGAQMQEMEEPSELQDKVIVEGSPTDVSTASHSTSVSNSRLDRD